MASSPFDLLIWTGNDGPSSVIPDPLDLTPPLGLSDVSDSRRTDHVCSLPMDSIPLRRRDFCRKGIQIGLAAFGGPYILPASESPGMVLPANLSGKCFASIGSQGNLPRILYFPLFGDRHLSGFSGGGDKAGCHSFRLPQSRCLRSGCKKVPAKAIKRSCAPFSAGAVEGSYASKNFYPYTGDRTKDGTEIMGAGHSYLAAFSRS